ncbi:MAG: hypothetical protein HDQ88_03495 [Clostridia bacterium]|nr:hypothetical protein [Clostridia bacterium]
MTNFEAISADLYPYDVPASLIEMKCIDEGVDQQAAYSAEGRQPVARATLAILRNLLVLKSESNGGFSRTYGTDELRERISALAGECGPNASADNSGSRTPATDLSASC